MANLNFWYSGQIRSYMLQFLRVFAGFQIKTGKGKDGTETFIKVPIRYSDMSRQVGHILRENSENMMLSCPFMTAHLTEISPSAERRQTPNHVSTVQVTERYHDDGSNQYTNKIGQAYSVERFMPVPYDLGMELNIWTSNTDQKLQLLEQLLVLFNPSLDLQTSNNPVDWSALTLIELESISWSSRSIPQGASEEIDIATLSFKMPIWLNPPAKVKRQKIIQQIVMNLMEHPTMLDAEPGDIPNWTADTKLDARVVISPNQYRIRLEGDIVTLLDFAGNEKGDDGKVFEWSPLLDQYGQYEESVSQIVIRTSTDYDNFENNIIGTIKLIPNQPNKLRWTVDPETVPRETIKNIHAIIDPHKNYPGKGLPAPSVGQRYLLLDEIGPCEAWGNIAASANDIIEFTGARWEVYFNSNQIRETHIVKNSNPNSLKHYKWNGQEWDELINGEYFPGSWRIFL